MDDKDQDILGAHFATGGSEEHSRANPLESLLESGGSM